MLNDKQTLTLSGLMAIGIFVTGVLEILDNFIVLTILTIIFLIIIANIFYTVFSIKKEEKDK